MPNKDFFIAEAVGKRGREYIETTIGVLILKKGDRPYEWYQDRSISIDKSNASKIRRGLEIPPLWLRLKIAAYFGVDSTLIWRFEDLPYIREVLKKQQEDSHTPENHLTEQTSKEPGDSGSSQSTKNNEVGK